MKSPNSPTGSTAPKISRSETIAKAEAPWRRLPPQTTGGVFLVMQEADGPGKIVIHPSTLELVMSQDPSRLNLENLRQKRDQILRITESYGARNVRIFGSVARGEESPESDLDLLVDLEPDRNLLDLSHLIIDLQDLLGRKVDVVEPEGLHWYIRDRVLKEAVAL
jgi:predicted nucleotidyltransferase